MLDPSTVYLTRHVVDRYMERRGWPVADQIARLDAEATIRQLLGRVAHQNPALWQKAGAPAVRRYVHGDLAWITDANSAKVITFYHHDKRSTVRNHRRKQRSAA